jgi:Amiloride-sensitive sodium channel
MVTDTQWPSLSIAFEHWPQVSYHREIRFGFIDFLVAFGSILALFVGFSLLSAIEVVLYVVKFIATKFCPKET